ncbi:MAG: pyridoxal phosphate-dependent aminotransferase [Candidatus Eisenbacteria sp.]|nr:pyridoxal phosphate-dependent aminotransferase [Candidatus Eisenbacteria bacterium]
MLAERMSLIGTSPTLAVSGKAKEMIARGVDVVDFSVGEPDFDTPEPIKRAGITAIEDNFTRYTASSGTLDLRRAICEKFRQDNQLSYEPDEIIVSTGAKQCLYNLAMALLETGDEVLLPTPCWVSYEPQISLTGAAPVFLKTDAATGFRITPDALRAAITPKTKALILNNPSNPTGAAYSREQLEPLAEILAEKGIWVIVDEIYEKLVYDGFAFTSFAALSPAWKDRCVLINGVSKTYAMTGWRIGYAAGPREVISAMGKIQSHSTSNANSIAQRAAQAAILGPQEEIARMRAAFEKRRDLMLSRLLEIPGVTCPKPQGAFYLLPDWRAYLGRHCGAWEIQTSIDLAAYFLEEAHVAVVPGVGFRAPEHLRFSYASSPDRIEEGMRRVREAAAKLE